jgi:hypothetical protein
MDGPLFVLKPILRQLQIGYLHFHLSLYFILSYLTFAKKLEPLSTTLSFLSPQ